MGFRLTEDNWPLVSSVGQWAVAIGLLIWEAYARHFQDSGGITIIAGLLGFPIIQNWERDRRDRNAPPDPPKPAKRR